MFNIKRAASIAAVLLLVSASAAADQLADIKQKGVLVCGTLGTAEPFSFPNPATREVQGYDVDFCKAVAKSLGVKLELKLISVAARIPELQQNRIDVLAANLGWTAERAQQIAYSDSYYVSLTKVATKRSDGYKKPADLAGKRVSAPKGSTSEMAVRSAIPTATTVTFQDPPAAFLAMQQGKVDGFAVSELMLLKFKQQTEATTPIDILEPAVLNEAWGIGMRKEESGLIKQVNNVLESMEKSGEAAQIFDKWLGANSPYKLHRGFKIEPIKG
ncbi:ABC transporter substrate-binding protein [Collimonas sp.]|jgi:polar amino acid transport system substrate-binding protein|uniref:ABC transporter substrate-binding protein n=1 Tax=Collimonas sp. TaxID=1963772 RepID=UPI002C710F51|nr:ABC transporter substrate-binding protein [Collimonas sp.]HWW08393.1 ABC transporter substrate-binding protein [Collimonas sp.]